MKNSIKKLLTLVFLILLTNSVYAGGFRDFLAEAGGKILYFFKLGYGDGSTGLIGKLTDAEWINLEYTIVNMAPDDQFIMLKNKQPLFLNNYSSSWIRIISEATIPENALEYEQLLKPIKNGAANVYTIGKLQYYYHTVKTNITTVQFQINAPAPHKAQRSCILKFHISSKGPQLNNYLNVINDSENKKYATTCVAYIETDPDALKQNCGWFWCERPRDRDYAKVVIAVLPPDTVALIKLVPACKQSQISDYPDFIFAYPESKNPKDTVLKEEQYAIQPAQSVCPGGKWIIKLPANFIFKKFQFSFTNSLNAQQKDIDNYHVDYSPEITGWPASREIQNAASCIYDRLKKTCELNIVPSSANKEQTAVIKTPEGKYATITLTNTASHANLIPTFEAWSLTPYRKPN